MPDSPAPRLVVWVDAWQLVEDRSTIAVGDELSAWLRFVEAERDVVPSERIEALRASATPLQSWPGAELDRHPTRLDVAGAALYWDAPRPVTGAVEVSGAITTDPTDAPEGSPMTRGVVRRVRMEWREPLHDTSAVLLGDARYEEVSVRSLPLEAFGPERGSTEALWTGVLLDLEPRRPLTPSA